MKYLIVTLLIALVISFSSSAEETSAPISVIHKSPTGEPLSEPPFRYMSYYRTEVKNNSNQPLKIVWFEGYEQFQGTWYPGNVLGRTLRGDEFSEWYTEGDKTDGGIILPGETAICDVNWHGNDSTGGQNIKWAFIAVDRSGNDYYIEATVDPSIIKLVVSK